VDAQGKMAINRWTGSGLVNAKAAVNAVMGGD